MTATPNLALPYIAAAQAQKHVTHNEAIRALDALVHLSVADRDRLDPPAAPWLGERYIIPAAATGAWSGHDGQIAAFQDGAWLFYPPQQGWVAWVADEDRLLAWTGTTWVIAGGEGVNPAPLVGVNTTADATNKLAVKSDATLFSHDDVTPGSGDMRQVLNKAAAGNTVSQLYQTNFSGRAETGLAGDDDFHVKVSPDGSVWHEALVADRNDGRIAVQGLKSIPANYASANAIIFTPGGDGTVSIYRIDTVSGQNPRTATIASVSGDIITLDGAVSANTIFASIMGGVSLARIWNTTLSAASHSAWVSAYLSATQIRVSDASHIAGWAAGHTIQLGDPTTITPGRCITLDISPMLTNLFGQPFRQTGIVVKANIIAATDGDGITITPTGVGGSFTGATKAPSSAGVTLIPCSELSPISNSNLVRLRETIATTAGIRLMSSMAVLG